VLAMKGRKVVGHDGFTGSVLLDFPDNGLVVIVLGNLDEASGNVVPELALSIASRFSHR
jgi:hypothetical protein